jgi:hypothetical protein
MSQCIRSGLEKGMSLISSCSHVAQTRCSCALSSAPEAPPAGGIAGAPRELPASIRKRAVATKIALLRLTLALLLLGAFPGCISMMEGPPSIPTAAENVGPKPRDPGAIIARWANAHYGFIPAAPFTPDEFVFADPKPISYLEIPFGRKVGWQVISGPENKRLQDQIELPYTRFIIHDGHIISIVSQSYAFREPQ